MLVDLNILRQKLTEAPPEDTVDVSEVNPYLLNEVIRPLLDGRRITYGDIDYSRFELDDLRVAAHYCETRDSVCRNLQNLIGGIVGATPAACKARAFC